jgi:hypothetical protein
VILDLEFEDASSSSCWRTSRRPVEEDPDPSPRPEQLEPLEDPQPVDPLLAAEPAQRLGEAHPHRVRR